MEEKETGKYWRVYVTTYGHATLYVSAPNADVALGRARERLAVDRLPSQYLTVTQPTAIGEWERKQFDVDTVAEVVHGRLLTADEIAYCNGRRYVTGVDIDAFHGVQLSHIVDDGVAFCRTQALWGADGRANDETRVSCTFCLDVLHQEMRYAHLGLLVDWRRGGAHAVAEVAYLGDATELWVNGIVVRRVERNPELGPNDDDRPFHNASQEMRELSDVINEAQAKREDAHPPPALPPRVKDGPYRRATYVAKRSAIEYEERLTDEQKTRLLSETAGLYQEMTEPEQAYVDAYFAREGG